MRFVLLFIVAALSQLIDADPYFDHELIYVANYFDTSTHKMVKNDTIYLLISGNKNRFAVTDKNYTYFDITDFDKKMKFDLRTDRDTNYYYQFPDISLNLTGYVKQPEIIRTEGYSCNKIIQSVGSNRIMAEFYLSSNPKLRIASHSFIGTGGKIISKFFGLPVLINEYSAVNNTIFRTVKLHKIKQVDKKILLSKFGIMINWS